MIRRTAPDETAITLVEVPIAEATSTATSHLRWIITGRSRTVGCTGTPIRATASSPANARDIIPSQNYSCVHPASRCIEPA
jgi:hypothetical protein